MTAFRMADPSEWQTGTHANNNSPPGVTWHPLTLSLDNTGAQQHHISSQFRTVFYKLPNVTTTLPQSQGLLSAAPAQ